MIEDLIKFLRAVTEVAVEAKKYLERANNPNLAILPAAPTALSGKAVPPAAAAKPRRSRSGKKNAATPPAAPPAPPALPAAPEGSLTGIPGLDGPVAPPAPAAPAAAPTLAAVTVRPDVAKMTEAESSAALAPVAGAYVKRFHAATPDGIARVKTIYSERFKVARGRDLVHSHRLEFLTILKNEMEAAG